MWSIFLAVMIREVLYDARLAFSQVAITTAHEVIFGRTDDLLR